MKFFESLNLFEDILNEDITAQQAGDIIVRNINDPNSAFRSLDIMTNGKWFAVTGVNGAYNISITPLNYEKGNIREAVLSHVPNNLKQQATRILEDWIGSRVKAKINAIYKKEPKAVITYQDKNGLEKTFKKAS